MISHQGKNRRTRNLLKAIYFDKPEWILCRVSLMPATWMKYREALEEIVLRYPRVFPGYRKGEKDFDDLPRVLYQPGRHTDAWGCIWENIEPGLDSIVVHAPLADWAAFDHWTPPDPLKDTDFGPRDWDQIAQELAQARARGDLVVGGGLPHGFMYMRLYYLRGFENLMLDLALGEPRLEKLISIVLGYNVAVIQKYLELGVECMAFGDDLGQQRSLPISPDMWRRMLKPCYEAMYGPCRDRGVIVRMHSDGHILEILPDLIETGVRVINPQIRANGLSGLQRVAKGRVAIDIDLDRQLFPFATAAQIEQHIQEIVAGLYLEEGGLMIHAECEPDVPLENIETICKTLEEVCRLPDPSVQ